MIYLVIVVGFGVAALINLLPVAGLFGAAQLSKLYGIPIEGRDLVILLRHRAVLFGIVGGLLAAAIFVPSLRTSAFLAGMVSMVSFVVLQWLEGGSNAALSRVVIADYVGITFLFAAGVAVRLEKEPWSIVG